MSRRTRRRQGPTMEEQAEEQRRTQREAAATERGLSEAQQGSLNLSQFDDSGIIDELSEPDIDRDDGEMDDLNELLAAEFGRHLALGNIESDEYSKQKLLDRARARLTKTEFPREGRIGSECSGRVRAIMTEEGEKPQLTDDMARQIDAAFEERTMTRSLSKDARGFRGVTEAIVETRSRNDSEDDDSGGGIINRLFG